MIILADICSPPWFQVAFGWVLSYHICPESAIKQGIFFLHRCFFVINCKKDRKKDKQEV